MIASDMMYMDSSIQFLRCLKKFEKENVEKFELNKGSLKKSMEKIVTIHNEMLRKKQKRIGSSFRGKITLHYILGVVWFNPWITGSRWYSHSKNCNTTFFQ